MSVVPRSLTGLVTLLASLAACAAPAAPQCQYEVTFIDPGADGISVNPRSINDHGDVVGYFSTGFGNDQPFLWTAEGDFIPIDIPSSTGRANDINNKGQIVGTLNGPPVVQGFLYENGGATLLQLPEWANWGEANAINDSGQIVGFVANVITGPNHAYMWYQGEMLALAGLEVHVSKARDIDNHGVITGDQIPRVGDERRAFLWADGLITVLPLVPGGVSSYGQGMNGDGHVVGRTDVPTPRGGVCWHAFHWNGRDSTDLGHPPGYTESSGRDINDVGQVVGHSDADELPRVGSLWQHGMMLDLNKLIDSDLGLHISWVASVNNSGVIAGAAFGGTGLVLTPKSAPVGDLDFDCQTGMHDLAILLDAWGQSDSSADLDGDGLVGPRDLAILLGNWE